MPLYVKVLDWAILIAIFSGSTVALGWIAGVLITFLYLVACKMWITYMIEQQRTREAIRRAAVGAATRELERQTGIYR